MVLLSAVGWWPQIAPDGRRVALTEVGPQGGPFAAYYDLVERRLYRLGAGRMTRLLSNERLTFIRDTADLRARRFSVDVGYAPLDVTSDEALIGANEFDGDAGHWYSWLGLGGRITMDDRVIATGAHGVSARDGYMATFTDNSHDRVTIYLDGVPTREHALQGAIRNVARAGERGWFGYGYYGESRAVAPDGTEHVVNVTPWRSESPPLVVFDDHDQCWLVTGTTIPGGSDVLLIRPFGAEDALVVPMPSAYFDVRYRLGQFHCAGNSTTGTLCYEAVRADAPRQFVLPTVPAFPMPRWFGTFFSFSDRYGDTPLYPQNCTVVVEADAVARAALRLPIIVSGDPAILREAARVSGRVLALYIGDTGGAPNAQREARAIKAAWKAAHGVGDKPVLWYVTPGEASRSDFFIPPDVDVLGPQFYFDEYNASFQRLDELRWRMLGFWLDKLGRTKPWMPICQAYDRNGLVSREGMREIAALQANFLRMLVDVDPRVKQLPPALGLLFFAVNRPGGAATYPSLRAWHEVMFRAIPEGPRPLFPNGGTPPPSPQPREITSMRIALQAERGGFFAAEGGGGSLVRANRPGIGAWETLIVFRASSGTGPLRYQDKVLIQTSNGSFFRVGEQRALAAGLLDAGGSGVFTLINPDHPGATDAITHKAKVALRTPTGKYVVALEGGPADPNDQKPIVGADRDQIGAWETHTIHFLDPQ